MKGLRIRLEQDGLKSSLFDLEAEIMEEVWALEEGDFSVADICSRLQEGREIAYTTVMTTISRLYEKGILDRKKEGKRYLYRSKQSREEFLVSLTKKVLSSLPDIGQETAMSLLVDHVATADASELDRLEALIRQRRKQHD